MDETYLAISKYVTANVNLCEAIERDIRNGNKISSDTVVKLSKMVIAAQKMQMVLDVIEADKVKLN